LLIESEFNMSLCNVRSVELLKDLLSFFNRNAIIMDDIQKRLARLEMKVDKMDDMNIQQIVLTQNIEETTATAVSIVENMSANLQK
jgi:hypothetical protein